MDEQELKNKRAELIARIPYLPKLSDPNYQKVEDQMNTLVWEEIDDPMTEAPGVSTKTVSGVYGIFATHAGNDVGYEQLKMHEMGHCVLQHFKDDFYKNEQAARQIRSKWSKFKEHIEMEGNDEDDISADFIHMLRNVTQDLEINGKWWPNQFEEVRERISDAALTRFINYANETQVESIGKWMDENPDDIHKFSRGLHPSDFGFPCGLTWMGYLHLILTQPNEFMENLNNQVDEMQRQQAAQQQQQGDGQGQSGQSQSGGNQQSGSSQGNNSQEQQNNDGGLQQDQTSIFNHKPQEGENQQGQDGQNGNSNQSGQGGNGKDQKDEGESSKGGKSKVKDDSKGKPEQGSGNGNKMKASIVKANAMNGDKGNEIAQAIAQAREDRGEGPKGQTAAMSGSSAEDDADDWSVPGDGTSSSLVDATPTMILDRKVVKFIEKHCIGKVVQRDRQDPLYNYNRGKTSGGVMRTRITTVEEYRPGNLIAIVDVSGSVNIELVKAFLNEMLKYKSKFGTKSRIILWDTELVDDLQLKKSELDKICCGGGTSIARGIAYAKQKYLKSEQDKLCIISDFEDWLSDWLKELSDVKGDAFGICWGKMDGKEHMKSFASNRKEQAAAQKFDVINVQ